MDNKAKRAFIEALGGVKAIAKEIKRSESGVHNWAMKDRRIPYRHRPTLARMAADRAIDIPKGFWQ